MISEPRDRFDKKLKKTLVAAAKPQLNPTLRNNVTAQLRDLVNEALEFGLSQAVDELSRFFLSRDRLLELRQFPAFPTARALELAQSGLEKTFEFAVSDSPEAFAELPAELLLRQISSTPLLNKISKKRKGLLQEALTLVKREPARAFEFAGLPWVFSKAKILDLLPLLPVLFRDQQASDSQAIATLRGQFLRRDKAGRGVTEILRRISAGEMSDEGLVETLNWNPQAAAGFVQLLPKLMSRGLDDQAAKIFQKWLLDLNAVPKKSRTIVSGALAGLCGMILLKERRRPIEDRILLLVTDSIKRLSVEIGADVGGYWGIFPLDESRTEASDAYISPEGARLLVESIEKLEDDRYAPREVFRAFALNLGLSQTEEPGTTVTFDPKRHEDVAGGLLRGQLATVIRPGWSHEDMILLKPKVKAEINNA